MSLTPQVFYILLSLVQKPLHGYGIMLQVREDSRGKISLGPGTLYGAIKRLAEDGLISEIKTRDSRRRFYRLTARGRSVFYSECDRLESMVKLVKKISPAYV